MKIERLTLGGALVLRQKGELLAVENNQTTIDLYINYDPLTQSLPKEMIHTVFNSTSFHFSIHNGKPVMEDYWPSERMLNDEKFSYYSLSRLAALYQAGLQTVRLKW